jgi:hypothetical protein
MSDGMLHDILEVERRIEEQLARERVRAEEWLAAQKAEIDQQTKQALGEAAAAACQVGAGRCQSARNDGAARIREMRQQVGMLRALSDAMLRQTLQRHLSLVTGGVHHDHPDGQN